MAKTLTARTARIGERVGIEFKDGSRATGRLTAVGSRIVRWTDREGVLREAERAEIASVISFDR